MIKTIFFLAAGLDVSTMGQCLTDTFSVTSPGSPTPPVICGDNNGQHSNIQEFSKIKSLINLTKILILVYVDASEACNILSFQLSGDVKRSWEIKVRTELIAIFC